MSNTQQSAQTKKEQPGKFVTGKVRLSYVHVWEPVAMSDGSGDKKYSVSIIIPKSDTKQVAAIQKVIDEVVNRGIEEKWKGKKPPKLKLPLRDGDEERPDDEAYKNSYFFTASSKTQPSIVNKAVQKILDQSEVYSGCYGRVSVMFYPFDSNGSKGVACGLNNIQKLEDGEALGGRSNPEDDFEVVDDEDLV